MNAGRRGAVVAMKAPCLSIWSIFIKSVNHVQERHRKSTRYSTGQRWANFHSAGVEGCRSDLPKSAALEVVGLKGPGANAHEREHGGKVSGRLVLAGSQAFMPPIFAI